MDELCNKMKRAKQNGLRMGQEIDDQTNKLQLIDGKMDIGSNNIDYSKKKIDKKL